MISWWIILWNILCVFPCLQLFHLQMMFANPARIFAPQPQLSFVSFKVFAPRMVWLQSNFFSRGTADPNPQCFSAAADFLEFDPQHAEHTDHQRSAWDHTWVQGWVESFATMYYQLWNVYLQSKIMVNAKTWTLAVLDRESPLSCALQLRKCAH